MKSIAIVVIAYNREKSLERLLNSIANARIEENTVLIISIDKSNNPLVEACARNYEWPFGEKRVVAHKENLGLKRHILGCGNYLDEFDAVVILEDDLIVAEGFFEYSRKAVEFYSENDDIAGISLYSFHINPHTGYPFFPSKNESDTFFIQYAPSWGQVWMKKQWKAFISWYEKNQADVFDLPHLPINISHWGKNSWLKYHIKYAIENSKYFVYPYCAFSSTFSDVGVHANLSYTYFQVVLQEGLIRNFKFPDLTHESVRYDCNFEREMILQGYEDLCVDLWGTKGNRVKKRYWLTTLSLPYKVLKSYDLCLKPIENNINDFNKGNSIFLYDTKEKANKPVYSISTKWYIFDIHFTMLLLKDYGINLFFQELFFYLKKKISKILKWKNL